MIKYLSEDPSEGVVLETDKIPYILVKARNM